MTNKDKVQAAISETKTLLKDVDQPERSLSFPVVLSFLLNGPSSTARSVSGKLIPEEETGEKSFEGLSGGMRLLIQENFFKEGRSQGEVFVELKRRGYHYPKSSIPPTLINLIQKRVLNRDKGQDGAWRYVERK